MHQLLMQFKNDHQQMNQLMVLFDRELNLLRDPASDSDYHLLFDIVRYFNHFPEVTHHPAEEMLYLRLKYSLPELEPVIDRLTEQHRVQAIAGEELLLLLESVCSGHMVPRDKLLSACEAFLENQTAHMRDEDSLILSNVDEWLNSEAWSALEADVAETFDPVISVPLSDQLQRLRDDINALATAVS